MTQVPQPHEMSLPPKAPAADFIRLMKQSAFAVALAVASIVLTISIARTIEPGKENAWSPAVDDLRSMVDRQKVQVEQLERQLNEIGVGLAEVKRQLSEQKTEIGALKDIPKEPPKDALKRPVRKKQAVVRAEQKPPAIIDATKGGDAEASPQPPNKDEQPKGEPVGIK